MIIHRLLKILPKYGIEVTLSEANIRTYLRVSHLRMDLGPDKRAYEISPGRNGTFSVQCDKSKFPEGLSVTEGESYINIFLPRSSLLSSDSDWELRIHYTRDTLQDCWMSLYPPEGSIRLKR